MIRTLTLAALTCLAATLPVRADDHIHSDHDDPAAEWSPEFQDLGQQDFRIISLHRAAEIVQTRYRGRLVAARLVAPFPEERARGVVLVHELRLLTPARDVLVIRLDARSGAFLETAGAGLTAARRSGGRK
ncbi:hypothetical protein [Paracoccus sp. (in: a-proteobacteria)]|uniref:PepSY domain-containing protein n=1 Tax=Paracoccus sp. TaxID=267 RepID=UPI0032201054